MLCQKLPRNWKAFCRLRLPLWLPTIDMDSPNSFYAYQWDAGKTIVTIDIGTSRCACSVSKVGSEVLSQDIVVPDGTLGGVMYQQRKVETALLLRPIDRALQPPTIITDADAVEVVAFGDNADTVFCGMDADVQQRHIF